MSFLLSALLSYVLLYRYVAIFAIIFSAGIIVPFPASAMLMGIGAFASHNYFNIWWVALTAIGANVLGDFFAFLLTRKYGDSAAKKMHIETQLFSTLERYVRIDAGPTIFITRFAGYLGPVTNVMAGLAGVGKARFLVYDLAGNALEILLLLFVGYMVGDYWQNFSNIQSLISGILILGVIAFFLWKVYGAIRRRYLAR
jgi:membrane-associated protein